MVAAALLLLLPGVGAQDMRSSATRVADLLARMPAEDYELISRLMEEMYSLGEEGWTLICDQVLPAGEDDDSRARYAITSLTIHLTTDSDNRRREAWERQCISYMQRAAAREVKAYFMHQLSLTGSDRTVAALADYLRSEPLCSDAVMTLQTLGTATAAAQLWSALGNQECPCAAQVMVALAETHPGNETELYRQWYSRGGVEEKGAALYAMAATGAPGAMGFLTGAAAEASYRNEPTGAVRSLLIYARKRGETGDMKSMERITSAVIAASQTPESAAQRLAAMSIVTEMKGSGAMPMLLKAANDPDIAIRGGTLQLAAAIPGSDVTKKWVKQYPRISAEAKPGLLLMLGKRGDMLAEPLIVKAMDDPSYEVATAAVTALAHLRGGDATPAITEWMVHNDDHERQLAAAGVLTTIIDSEGVSRLVELLPDTQGEATITVLRLLAWRGDSDLFSVIYPYTASDDESVRMTAIYSLQPVASYDDQQQIITLLGRVSEKPLVAELQRTLLAAAARHDDPEQRAAVILTALDGSSIKEQLIPLLGPLGGKGALKRVKHEFDEGDAVIRDAAFDALAHWRDHSATKALLEITASGNKTFGRPAFEAYMRMVAAAAITSERKLLMVKDIAPYAADPSDRAGMVAFAASLGLQQSRFFAAHYLDDVSDRVRETAAEAVASLAIPGEEFESMFNGRDLTGWQGLVGNPVTRAAMTPRQLAARQKEADARVPGNWTVRDGMIWFSGTGDNLCSVKEYGDFEMYVDWRITKAGDSGIYLRGSPQVQIWDTSRVEVGARVGSGGLYNNQKHQADPLTVADNPVGEWNTFRIMMRGEVVSVWLNGELVVDNVIMENYWDRSIPIFERGAVELQAHGTDLAFRDIYIREIEADDHLLTDREREEGFVTLFNGRNLDGWMGDTLSYVAEEGMIVIRPGSGSGGNLYTRKEYSDFVFRFEFMLTPGANNGLGVRTPPEGDAAYAGMEIQILDNTASIYAELEPWQYHGSVYGVIAARRGFLRPLGEWNYEEVTLQGTRVKVVLNGTVIVDGDIGEASREGTIDGKEHPGLMNRSGHIAFLGHGSLVKFKNIRIKEL